MKDPNAKIVADKSHILYTLCVKKLKDSALTTDPEKLVPLEAKEDIHSVDYKRIHRVFHKIVGTRIKQKIKKYELVL